MTGEQRHLAAIFMVIIGVIGIFTQLFVMYQANDKWELATSERLATLEAIQKTIGKDLEQEDTHLRELINRVENNQKP